MEIRHIIKKKYIQRKNKTKNRYIKEMRPIIERGHIKQENL